MREGRLYVATFRQEPIFCSGPEFLFYLWMFFTERNNSIFFHPIFYELLSFTTSCFMVWRNYTTVFPYNIIIVRLKIWLIIILLLKYSTNQELIFMFSDNADLLFPNRCIPEEFFKEQKKKKCCTNPNCISSYLNLKIKMKSICIYEPAYLKHDIFGWAWPFFLSKHLPTRNHSIKTLSFHWTKLVKT
jgi:hypothetical protein